jgi:redox-sensitive bicupin YhaK (pirin superfamily)
MKKLIEHILEGRRGGFQELISAVRDQQPPVFQQEGVDLRLASGLYDGVTGPLRSLTPIISISGRIGQGKRVQFTATPGYWTLLYIASGKACINQESIDKYHLVIFEKANDEIILTAEEDAQILFLSAIADYNHGIFGTLPY